MWRGASLAEMVARCGLEERTLLRRFRKATGQTPLDYCRQIRIARAREALESSAAALGASVVYKPVADQESAGVHDTLRLATAYRDVMESAARAQARRRA